MPQERIEVIFVAKGQRQVERSIVQMAKAADSLQKSADKAAKSIDQMGKSSGGTGKVSTGVQKASRDVKRLGNDAQKTAGRVNSLWKSLTVPAATGASIRETGRALNSLVGRFAAFYTGRLLVGISDEFGRMSNILSGFGVAASEIDKVRKSINKVANAARVDAVQAATLFGRLRQATKGLGLTSRDLVGIVGTVNKALRLGGASSLEASQSIRQLSQAFNKGKLDGDEFRSVMENAPILQDLLTEKLGVTKDALFDLAAQGKITARDLVGAFQEGADAIDEKFGKRIDTIGDALAFLKNEFREVFGTRVSGPAKLLVQSIVTIANSMERLLRLFTVFASIKIFSALAVKAAAFVATLSKAVVLMKSLASFGTRYGAGAALAVGAKQIGLRGAASFIPVVGQIALVAYTLYEVADAFGLFGKSAKEVAEETEAAAERMRTASRNLAAEQGKTGTGLPLGASRALAAAYTEASIQGAALRERVREGTTTRSTGGQALGVAPSMPVFIPTPGGGSATILSESAKKAQAELDQLIDRNLAKIEGEAISLKELLDTLPEGVDALGDALRKQVADEFGALNKALENTQKLQDRIEKKARDAALRSLFPGFQFSDDLNQPILDSAEQKLSIKDAFRALREQSRSEIGELAKEMREQLDDALIKTFGGGIDPKIVLKDFTVERLAAGIDPKTRQATPKLLASLIEKFREYRKAITVTFTEQERLGDSFTEHADKVNNLRDRLELLREEQQSAPGIFGLYSAAILRVTEQLDKLGGSFGTARKAAVKQGSAIRELSDEQIRYIGSMKDLDRVLRDLSAGFSIEKALERLKAERAANEERRRAEGLINDQNAATRVANAAQQSILQTLRQQRAELEAIGRTQQENARLAFIAKGPTKAQLNEFDLQREQIVQKEFGTTLESGLQALKDVAVKVQQLRDIEGLPEGQSEKIDALLNSLKEQASQLGATIGESGQEGSKQILQAAAEFLKTEAGEAGRILGAALSNAFSGALQAGIAGASAIRPGSPFAQLGPAGEFSRGPLGSFDVRSADPGGAQVESLNQITKKLQEITNSFKTANDGATKLQNNIRGFGAISAGPLKQLSSSAERTANDIQGFFESAFGTLEDALVEFVTTGEFDFKKFINAIIADLARLVIRMLIIRPLMNFFGGIFGFGFANGGLVGTDGTIKKYATGGSVGGVGGTTADNQLIMASRGEYVLNAGATRRIGAAYLDRLNSGGSPRSERRTVGSSTINFAPQITVVNEGGSGQDGQQQGEQIGTMVRQSFTELLMKETRPGGMLESVNRKGFA